MATLTIQSVSESGLEATYAATAAGGDQFVNDGSEVIHVKNADASDSNITVTAQNTAPSIPGYGTATKANIVVTCTAGEERFIGPFPKTAFNDTSGYAQVTYSNTTSVTIAVLRVSKAV